MTRCSGPRRASRRRSPGGWPARHAWRASLRNRERKRARLELRAGVDDGQDALVIAGPQLAGPGQPDRIGLPWKEPLLRSFGLGHQALVAAEDGQRGLREHVRVAL